MRDHDSSQERSQQQSKRSQQQSTAVKERSKQQSKKQSKRDRNSSQRGITAAVKWYELVKEVLQQDSKSNQMVRSSHREITTAVFRWFIHQLQLAANRPSPSRMRHPPITSDAKPPITTVDTRARSAQQYGLHSSWDQECAGKTKTVAKTDTAKNATKSTKRRLIWLIWCVWLKCQVMSDWARKRATDRFEDVKL